MTISEVHSSSSPPILSLYASAVLNPSHISRNGPTTIPARAISVHSLYYLSVLRPLHPLSIALLSVLSPLNARKEGWGPRDDSADTSLDRGSGGLSRNGGLLYVCYSSSRHTAFELRDDLNSLLSRSSSVYIGVRHRAHKCTVFHVLRAALCLKNSHALRRCQNFVTI